MSVDKTSKLGPGDKFPGIKLALVGGGSRHLPDDFDTPYTIVLFYRGHW